jgi:hypothetical protein
MSDLAERLREDPTLYAYIAADRIEELEKIAVLYENSRCHLSATNKEEDHV